MRLIGYTRVSRVAGREGESFISVDVQRERIERQAAAQGHTVVDWQDDQDQTGARIDRFARSVAGAAKALDRLESADGVLVSADLGMDTSTSGGKMMRNVLM